MTAYEVTVHTHVGRLYQVSGDSPGAAEDHAMRRYTEMGEDGDEILYETIDRVEVTEVPAREKENA